MDMSKVRDLFKRRTVKVGLVVALVAIISLSMFDVYQYGTQVGFNNAITSLAQALQQAGANVDIVDLGDGRYQIVVHFPSEGVGMFQFSAPFELHMWVRHFDSSGNLISETYHPMSLTNLGKNWIADKLSGENVNWSNNATYISTSNSSAAFSATWTSIPDEITTDGLSRADGTITDTGTGTWNCTNTFNVTGSNSTKLYGYSYASSGGLIAAEQQNVANQKNVANGDTLHFRT